MNNDFIKQTVMLPVDDVDDDDEEDARIAKMERARRNHVERGNAIYGI